MHLQVDIRRLDWWLWFITLLALWDPSLIPYWIVLAGTFMVTLFNRCIIARVLLLLPWNRGVRLN